ncbi:hypothetical protein QA300_002170 [Escherichia coli]|nr:hypothetical protein [Escherichia coli]
MINQVSVYRQPPVLSGCRYAATVAVRPVT